MKKTTFFVLIFCSLVLVNARSSGGSASNTVTAYDFNFWSSTDDYYLEPSWDDLQLNFVAYIPSTAPGYVAYATANWTSTGPNPYAHYGTGPYSGTSSYVSYPNAWLTTGHINLAAGAYGPGSYAGVWATW